MMVRARVAPALPLYRTDTAFDSDPLRIRTKAHREQLKCGRPLGVGIVLSILLLLSVLTMRSVDETYAPPPDPPKSGSENQHAAVPRGVAPRDAGRYNSADDGSFVCDGGLRVLRVTAINDDFCDCVDGTDEPGTAACAAGRFFCPQEERYLPSNFVDDGVCDCCNGADEARTRCADACDAIRGQRAAAAARAAQGGARRQSYVARARAAHAADDAHSAHFGPDQAFFPLAGKCFSKHTGEYEVDVCFFESVKQKSRDSHNVVLGQHFTWETPGTVGIFSDGDACPNGQHRSAKVVFFCDVEEKFESVSEPERCVYELSFGTPAACAA